MIGAALVTFRLALVECNPTAVRIALVRAVSDGGRAKLAPALRRPSQGPLLHWGSTPNSLAIWGGRGSALAPRKSPQAIVKVMFFYLLFQARRLYCNHETHRFHGRGTGRESSPSRLHQCDHSQTKHVDANAMQRMRKNVQGQKLERSVSEMPGLRFRARLSTGGRFRDCKAPQ